LIIDYDGAQLSVERALDNRYQRDVIFISGVGGGVGVKKEKKRKEMAE
jgi:hypothetical protein